ncbi:hypothetical protein GCM10009785_33450 [Brooklawnia cerclae]|uniref:Uncharacterized protein n=1 Tax=Brooklawnia cerclae TaxID=349934 RepID=A0ABX0SCW6_9ACTN|nr:hypothetical protein [Brooklawnia cerclae]NIH55739.1 hypothetical protein [Brooklawnia cerclae]
MNFGKRISFAAELIAVLTLTACSSAMPIPSEPLPRISEYTPSTQDWELLEQSKAAFAKGYGIVDPPDFEVITWINPEDVPNIRVPCIRALGTSVTATEDGYQITSPNDRQAELDHLAEYQCFAQYPVRQDIRRPPEGDEIKQVYDHLENNFIPCLNEAGYPGLRLPSYGTFADSMKRSELEVAQDLWNQLVSLYPDEDENTLSSAYLSCPQRPDGFRTYQK